VNALLQRIRSSYRGGLMRPSPNPSARSSFYRATRDMSGREPTPFQATLCLLMTSMLRPAHAPVCERHRARGALCSPHSAEERLGSTCKTGASFRPGSVWPESVRDRAPPALASSHENRPSTVFGSLSGTHRSIATCCAVPVLSGTTLRRHGIHDRFSRNRHVSFGNETYTAASSICDEADTPASPQNIPHISRRLPPFHNATSFREWQQ
jgi:hypothetical protein